MDESAMFLSGVAGVLLSLVMSYVPKLKDRYKMASSSRN